jgi:ParG
VPPGLGHPVAPRTHNQIDSPSEKGGEFIKKAAEPQVKRMNLNVPVELHNSFKATTAAQGQNMTDVLLSFIQRYIADNGQRTKQPKGRRR